MDLSKDRRFESGPCINCNAPLDSVAGHDFDPGPGSIMVCASCSYVMEWDGAKFIELTPEAIKELQDEPELKEALAYTKLFRLWKDERIKIVVLEELPPEICQECAQLAELRPYGRRQENGVRKWVCKACAEKDPAEMERAFEERLEGTNPV